MSFCTSALSPTVDQTTCGADKTGKKKKKNTVLANAAFKYKIITSYTHLYDMC